MLGRLGRHVRSNVVGYLALFVAMSGSADALQGKNTVFSDDIVNEQVKANDIGRNAISSVKIGDGQVSGRDIADSAIDGTKIVDGTLTGSDLTSESGLGLASLEIAGLTGNDIIESTLTTVPSARLAGHGRSDQDVSCDPESSFFALCASVDLTLTSRGRVLIHGYGTGYAEPGSSDGEGRCLLATSATGNLPNEAEVFADANSGGEFGLSTVTPVLEPGFHQFEVRCAENIPGYDPNTILFEKVSLSVIQLSPY